MTTLEFPKWNLVIHGAAFTAPEQAAGLLAGFSAPEVAFVGDRLYTDVATGVKNGAVGLLVLTGETHLEDVPTSEVQPDAIFASLGEMGQQLCQL